MNSQPSSGWGDLAGSVQEEQAAPWNWPSLPPGLFVTSYLNVFFSAYVLPRANHAFQVQTLEILAQTAARQVEPRVFYEEWKGIVLYVFEIEPGTDLWHGVFLAPSVPSAQHTVTIAKSGRLQVDKAGREKSG